MQFQTLQAAEKLILEKFHLSRDPRWPEIAKAFLSRHPGCAACGGTSRLNVHHIFPFHYVVLCGRPDLELDFRNLVTLCADPQREHHLLLGHLDDYESFDPQLKRFIHTYYGLSQQQIRETSTWCKAHANKPHHLDQMSEEQKSAFKMMLDAKFPQINPR